MPEQSYQIVMRTPLGPRNGSMCCRIAGESLEGTLSLMGHTQPFHGTITSEGHCWIEGSIKTLMRLISYCGRGEIREGALHISIQGDRRAYDIDGILCEMGETV